LRGPDATKQTNDDWGECVSLAESAAAPYGRHLERVLTDITIARRMVLIRTCLQQN